MSEIAEHVDELYELAGAQCEGRLSVAQIARLEELVLGDARLRRMYIIYMHLHARAEQNWTGDEGEKTERGGRRTEGGRRRTEGGRRRADTKGSRIGNQGPVLSPPASGLQPLSPPIVLDPSATHYSPSTSHSSLGNWVFSYTVATLFVCFFILGAWAIKITHRRELANNSRRQTTSGKTVQEPQMVFVGRITGMAEVKWSQDPDYLPPLGAHVSLGREYKLDSGLMQITYDTGARVILEGPCSYKVESARGGYLALGKLTARIEEGRREKREKGAKSQTANPKSRNPRIPESPNPRIPKSPNPFVVRTPTAIVTDLGTEFAVEVDGSGGTRSHVFQGTIEIRPTAASTAGPVRLGVGETALVDSTGGRIAKRRSVAGQSARFARRMPRRERLALHNTGVGLREGAPDPHWQIVARSDDPDFEPRPAVVSEIKPGAFRPNEPGRSQWVALVDKLGEVPNDAIYTFRYAFELPPDANPDSARLRGRFMADNHVKAIRVNGEPLAVPEHGYIPPFIEYYEFWTREGFVAGTNVLEIDVENSSPEERKQGVERNPMLLRVELRGSCMRGYPVAADRPRKGDEPMNDP